MSSNKVKIKLKKTPTIIIIAIIILILLLHSCGFKTKNKPLLSKQEEDVWDEKEVVEVEKEPTPSDDIVNYQYCIEKEKKEEKCVWTDTYTKNVELSTDGIYNVKFRSVYSNKKYGTESNETTVKIDNTAPIINKIEDSIDGNSLTIKVYVTDTDSGIYKYYYKIDDNEFIESSKDSYTFKNLDTSTSHTIVIKVVDNTGNEKIITYTIDFHEEEIENNINKPQELATIPKISLNGIPSTLIIGDDYDLPTSYEDIDLENIVCTVDDQVIKNTKELGLGNHQIKCVATNDDIEIIETKNVEVRLNNENTADKWDGWILLELEYPKNSTNWEWRIGREEEIRDGSSNTSWQPYLGPITIREIDKDNVYIRYKLNEEEVITPPDNKLTIDIEPESLKVKEGEKTTVKINYEQDSDKVEYRLDEGDWKEYTKPFEVGPNTLISARVSKKIDNQEITSYDYCYISLDDEEGNEEEIDLPDIPDILEGPTIELSTRSKTDQVTVSISSPDEARKIYYRLGTSEWKEYKGEFIVDENTTIYAYYITKDEGRTSKTSSITISNISDEAMPYLEFSIEKDNNSRIITITGYDYDNLEYSYDGKIYFEYEGPLRISNNKRIYAKAINENGETIEYLDITDIDDNPPTPITKDLNVKIKVSDDTNPDGLLSEVEVSIIYDDEATERYYSIDNGGVKEYTGPFKVYHNSIIKAYAKNNTGYGEDSYEIDYMYEGIKEPKINIDISETDAYAINVSINYDDYSHIKKYKIDDGDWQEYKGKFTILNNNTTITAYNENKLGDNATTTYTINNIIKNDNFTLNDKGKYYVLSINYPKDSEEDSRQYKWGENGDWQNYDENLKLILIKKDYKDDLINNNNKVIINEGNQKLTYNDEQYFVVNRLTKEYMKNLYVRMQITKNILDILDE